MSGSLCSQEALACLELPSPSLSERSSGPSPQTQHAAQASGWRAPSPSTQQCRRIEFQGLQPPRSTVPCLSRLEGLKAKAIGCFRGPSNLQPEGLLSHMTWRASARETQSETSGVRLSSFVGAYSRESSCKVAADDSQLPLVVQFFQW